MVEGGRVERTPSTPVTTPTDLSFCIIPSASILCSRQKSSQHAVPMLHPAWPMWIDTTSRIVMLKRRKRRARPMRRRGFSLKFSIYILVQRSSYPHQYQSFGRLQPRSTSQSVSQWALDLCCVVFISLSLVVV
jgi:hypothetical protein